MRLPGTVAGLVAAALIGAAAPSPAWADDATYYDVTVGEPQVGRAAARDNVIKVFMAAARTWSGP